MCFEDNDNTLRVLGFLYVIKSIICVNVAELLVAEYRAYDKADYGSRDGSVRSDNGSCEDKSCGDAEGCGCKTDRGGNNVNLLEVSLNKEGDNDHTDEADDNAYDVGLKTDYITCDSVDEGERKEKILN